MADDPAANPYAGFMGGIVDPSRQDIHVSAIPREASNQRSSRIRIEEEDARHRRRKDMITHVAMTVGLLVLALVGLYGAFFPVAPETRQLATALMTAIATGTVSYFTGKNAAR